MARDPIARHGDMAEFVQTLLRTRQEVEFLWPSRGPDWRSAASGKLPPNATPFPIDDSPELRAIADSFAVEPDERASAFLVTAVAAAVQGVLLDAVDVPSRSPLGHLVRPIFSALGAGVAVVVGSWLGDPIDVRRNFKPEPPTDAEISALIRQHTRSTEAIELCHVTSSSAYDVARRPTALHLSPPPPIPGALVSAALLPWRPRQPEATSPDVTFVVTVVDDHPLAVGATLASLGRQRGVALEVVVVDDGSREAQALRETVAAAGSFARVARQGRQGPTPSLNRGLREARAPYVAFVLPGTVLAEDFTERAYALLEHPDDLCAVVADVAPEPERSSGDRRPKSPREPLALVIRRSVALAVGGFNTAAPIDLITEMQARGYDMARLE
jgi:hypothetical protein